MPLSKQEMREYKAMKARQYRAEGRYAPRDYAAEYARNKDKRRARNLRENYGLTLEEYDVLAADGCQICGALHSKDGRRLCVDHDHVTGMVRGVLCASCNLAIGHMSDDPAKLRLAAAYLER